MNVFGEPLARANDPAAIAPAAAVLMIFRREFFSASLSDLDLRITSPLFRYFLREAIRHKKHKKVYARREYSLGLRSPLPIRFVFFVFLCALFVAPQVSLSTQSAGDLWFFAYSLHTGDHILQLLPRRPSSSLAQSAIGRKRQALGRSVFQTEPHAI